MERVAPPLQVLTDADFTSGAVLVDRGGVMGACDVGVALGDEFEEERCGFVGIGVFGGRGDDEALREVEVVIGTGDGLGLDVVGVCGSGEAGDVVELGGVRVDVCVRWGRGTYSKPEDTLLAA